MKIILSIFCTVLLSIAAHAQTAGLYTQSGSTNSLPAGTTNQFVYNGVTNQFGSATSTAIVSSNLVLNVEHYDNAGYTFQCQQNIGDTNNTVFGVLIYPSYDKGLTFKTNAGWVLTNNWNGPAGTVWTAATNLSIPGVTTLGFSFINADTNTAGVLTNVLSEVHLKRPVYDFRTSAN